MEKELVWDLLEKQQTLDYIKYACYNLIVFASHDETPNPRIVREEDCLVSEVRDPFVNMIETFIELVKENRELKAKLGDKQ